MTISLARRCAAALTVAVLAAGVAGCSGAEEDPAADPTAGASEPTEPSDEPTDPTEPSDDPTPSAYLTVDGVDLTEPGTELRFGDPAVIAWEAGRGKPAAVEVTVDRVDRTSFEESFKGWVITKEMKRQTPLFVRLGVTNVGGTNLSGEQLPIAVIDDAGIRVQPTTAAEKEFKPCPGGPLPARFKADAKTELCVLYLLAPEAKFAAVGFLPVDAAAEPVGDAITWTGRLTAVGERLVDDSRRGKQDRRGNRDRRGDGNGGRRS